MKIVLLTFANELFIKAARRLEYEARLSGYFDEVLVYTEKDFDEEYLAKYGKWYEDNPRGYGYWIWKSYFASKVLNTLSDNDILVYLDGGCAINLFNKTRFNIYLDLVRKSKLGVLCFYNGYTEREWTKGDIFNELGCYDNKSITDSTQIMGGIWMMEKRQSTTAFVQRWRDFCHSHLSLVNDTPSITPNLPGFHENRHDQSVFSLLLKTTGGYTVLPDTEVEIDVPERTLGIITYQKHSNQLFLALRDKKGIFHDFQPDRQETDTASTNNHCLVSIVTITYNNILGLKKTAESILNQTYQNYEWIVIDGGSNDGTKEYIASLDRQPDYWVSEPDSGVYNAQNKGIARAKGDYVICMNAGDTFHDATTLTVTFKDAPDADILYGDWIRSYPEHDEICCPPKKLPPLFFYYSNICHQAMFVRTSILQNSPFDESLKIFADWKKWRELAYQKRTFRYIPVVVCDYEAGLGLSDIPSEQNTLEHQLLYDSIPEEIAQEFKDIRKGEREYISKLECRIHELGIIEGQYNETKLLVERYSAQLEQYRRQIEEDKKQIEQYNEELSRTYTLLENKTKSRKKYRRLFFYTLSCLILSSIAILIFFIA